MPPDKKDETQVEPNVVPDAEPDAAPDVEPADAPYGAPDESDTIDEFESPDKIDAVLRDPDVPGDVRAFFVTLHAVNTYVNTREFYTDEAGVTQVRLKPAPAPDETSAEG